MKNGITGKVQTVLGPVDPGEMGVTMPSECLFSDVSLHDAPPVEASAREVYFAPLSPEVLAMVRHYGSRNIEDMRLGDMTAALSEVGLYRQWGGGSIVDVATSRDGRDPIGLARISRALGVRVVMSSGIDSAREGPGGQTEQEITAAIEEELLDGAAGTGIRAGLIGPVRLSALSGQSSYPALRAAGRAQRQTGAPLMLHGGPEDPPVLAALEVLDEVGADLRHVMVGDMSGMSRDLMARVMKAGCYGLFSSFGRAPAWQGPRPGAPGSAPERQASDDERLEKIEWLISQGFEQQVLISQGINARHRLFRYGGHGYFYICGNIVPRMRARGFSEETVSGIVSGNPSRALAFGAPARDQERSAPVRSRTR